MGQMFMRRHGIQVRYVLFAGLAGGLAEMLWVMFYGVLTGTGGAEVARQITASVFPSAGLSYAVPLGIGVHLGLSLLLAAGFTVVVWGPFVWSRGAVATMASALCVLAVVWALNFFVLLPHVNPVFVELLPYPVTLASKLLFGIAMAAVLIAGSPRCWRVPHVDPSGSTFLRV